MDVTDVVSRDFDTGGDPGQVNLFDGSGDPVPAPSYRDEGVSLVPPVRAVSLPESFATKLRQSPGSYRFERLVLARAAYIKRRADGSTKNVRKAFIRPPAKDDPDDYASSMDRRGDGALRGLVEDIWRRIFKQAPPTVETEGEGMFYRLSDKVRGVVQQSEHVIVRGPRDHRPADDSSTRSLEDFQGRRLPLSEELETAAQGRLAPTPPPCVRCTGPKPSGSQAFWACFEKQFAHQRNLHHRFTEAISSPEVDEDRRPAEAPRFETEAESIRAHGARQISIGRWRPGEAQRPDRLHCAVRVPWIIADIGRPLQKGSRWHVRHVRSLLSSLPAIEIDLSDIVVTYSGGDSIQVRIPDGLLGCPIYPTARAAANAIRHFFFDLAPSNEVVRNVLDTRLFYPDRLFPVIGSTDPETGRRVVGTDAESFLENPAESLLSCSGQDVKYGQQEHCPPPRQADFHWLPFLFLDPSRRDPDHRHAGGAIDGKQIEYIVRQSHSSYGDGPGIGTVRSRVLNRLASGVARGENWGTDIDSWYRGRNRAALFVAHDSLRAYEHRERAWRAVKAWNSRNRPPLPEDELRMMFDKARDNWPGW